MGVGWDGLGWPGHRGGHRARLGRGRPHRSSRTRATRGTGSHVLAAYFVPRTQSRCCPNRTPGTAVSLSWGRTSESTCGQGCTCASSSRSLLLRWPGVSPRWKPAFGIRTPPPPPAPPPCLNLTSSPRGPTSKQPHGRSGFQHVNLGTPVVLRHAARSTALPRARVLATSADTPAALPPSDLLTTASV